MLRIKICGITTPEEAIVAADAGADAIGMVFANSRRQVGVNISREICRAVPPFVSKVGVFVDEEAQKVQDIADYCGLDTLQFHGSESIQYCSQFPQKVIKAFRVKDEQSLAQVHDYAQYTPLLDSYAASEMGGTGSAFKWDLAIQAAKQHNIILAGGLKADNVILAIETVRPYAVDVSSGVETNGKKDFDKIRRFINTIRRWEYHGK